MNLSRHFYRKLSKVFTGVAKRCAIDITAVAVAVVCVIHPAARADVCSTDASDQKFIRATPIRMEKIDYIQFHLCERNQTKVQKQKSNSALKLVSPAPSSSISGSGDSCKKLGKLRAVTEKDLKLEIQGLKEFLSSLKSPSGVTVIDEYLLVPGSSLIRWQAEQRLALLIAAKNSLADEKPSCHYSGLGSQLLYPMFDYAVDAMEASIAARYDLNMAHLTENGTAIDTSVWTSKMVPLLKKMNLKETGANIEKIVTK